MNRKELKKLIKAHEIKQVCSKPTPGLMERVQIIYKHQVTGQLWSVFWYTTNHKAECLIFDCIEEQLEYLQNEIAAMHNNIETVESIHRLYNKCTDTMNSDSATMDEKIVAKYIRKACDFFIHDRRYH